MSHYVRYDVAKVNNLHYIYKHTYIIRILTAAEGTVRMSNTEE